MTLASRVYLNTGIALHKNNRYMVAIYVPVLTVETHCATGIQLQSKPSPQES